MPYYAFPPLVCTATKVLNSKNQKSSKIKLAFLAYIRAEVTNVLIIV